MQPLTKQSIADNAFRRLGVSALASQAEIDAAARGMRIWPDPSRIPPTPFDLSDLGPIRRARSDIEQAVARLAHPATRLEERLAWRAVAPGAAAGGDAKGAQAAHHDQWVSALHRALFRESEPDAVKRWEALLATGAGCSADPAYADWVAKVERDGNFEKRVTPPEIHRAISDCAAAVADAVAASAQRALDRGDTDTATALLAVLNPPGGADGEVSAATGTFLDRLEDQIAVEVREVDRELRDKLRTNRSNPAPFHAANRAAAAAGATAYNQRIYPVLLQLGSLAVDDPERVLRFKSSCASLLGLIALGWEWAGDFATAESTLVSAVELAEGSQQESSLRADLDRCAALARQPRRVHRKSIAAAKKPARRPLQWSLIVAFFVISRIATLFTSNPTPAPIPTRSLPAFRVPRAQPIDPAQLAPLAPDPLRLEVPSSDPAPATQPGPADAPLAGPDNPDPSVHPPAVGRNVGEVNRE